MIVQSEQRVQQLQPGRIQSALRGPQIKSELRGSLYPAMSFWAVSVAVTAGKRHLRLFAPPDLVFLPQMELSAPLRALEGGPAPRGGGRPLRRSWWTSGGRGEAPGGLRSAEDVSGLVMVSPRPARAPGPPDAAAGPSGSRRHRDEPSCAASLLGPECLHRSTVLLVRAAVA